MSERSIFMEALEFDDPREREAYILRACGGDERLRARVEALLRRHQSDDSLALDRMAAVEVAVTADLPTAAEHPGTVLGPYKLLQEIGEGGMGTVYMAEQTRPVKRLVALKVIKAGMDSRQVLARFEAERQALALMDHPHIAKVLDAGATDDGRPYFIMELVKGVPITQFCDERRLTPCERLELFVPVCQAVQHAHQKGIIHRDLKPSNVLIALYDGRPVPKVIDFGVAKATGPRLTERTLFTEFGSVVGTPQYMSPEQAELNQLDVDTRSDIYSLGVLLYELLTGTTPLEPRRLKQAALLEVLRLIREEEPPRPSTRLSITEELPSIAERRGLEPKRLSGLVRGELDWIVMKCLEKDRTRRYETASGLAADVRRYLDDEPVAACPPSAWYRFGKLARRHRAALMTAALVLAALAVGTAVSTWQAIRATRAERGTATALTEAQRRATESQAVVDFLIKDLIAAAAPGQNQGPKTPVEAVLARADARVEGRFADQPLVEAAIRDALGRSYVELERHDKAEPHLNRAIALRRGHLGPEHPDTLASLYALTQMLHVRDFWNVERQKELAALCQQVVDARRRVLGPDHPDTIDSLVHLAFVLRVAGRPDEALALFQQTYDVSVRLWGPEDPTRTLTSLHGLASAHVDLGHREEAIDLFRRVLALRLRVQAPDDPQVLWALGDLLLLLQEMGRFEEGALLREQVLERHERVFGLCDSRTGCMFSTLYRTFKGCGRWDDVRVNSERWLAKVVRLTPDQEGRASDPEWRRRRGERLGQLVWQLVTLPDPRQIDARACVRAAEEAHAVSPDATYVDHFARYPSARTVLGLAYYRARVYDKVIATLDQATGTRDDDGFDRLILAMTYARRGDLAQARAWFDKAAQWREEHPERNEWIGRLRAEAAQLLSSPAPAAPAKKDVPRPANG
jgi:serine/threonine protein kinase/tetratricopeptide (TPR) repeat protein